MDSSQHFERLGRLLEAERDAERARLDEARRALSLAEREARGIALADVEAVEESGLAGRTLVAFARADRKPLAATRIGVGAMLRPALRREPRDDAPLGIVARVARARVTVAFDEPPPDWVTDGRIVLELEPSTVTWDRLAAGLARMRAADARESRRWAGPLGGLSPLR